MKIITVATKEYLPWADRFRRSCWSLDQELTIYTVDCNYPFVGIPLLLDHSYTCEWSAPFPTQNRRSTIIKIKTMLLQEPPFLICDADVILKSLPPEECKIPLETNIRSLWGMYLRHAGCYHWITDRWGQCADKYSVCAGMVVVRSKPFLRHLRHLTEDFESMAWQDIPHPIRWFADEILLSYAAQRAQITPRYIANYVDHPHTDKYGRTEPAERPFQTL